MISEQEMPKALELDAKSKRYLKSMAHHMRAIVTVGQHGVTEGVIGAIDVALLQHELIKVRMHEPDNKKQAAQDLAAQTGSCMCALIGHTVVLYRPHPEEPEIKLPR
ncbi:MAG: ribosome assembly RNA-binding protein YhbY [Deltaproteobacteria bacterium]|jgi:RNA-binding protein|nr:ribosome assembly RNA-binding protein YhbY [Deltaproteobacteria bacterium]MBT6435308.1 ribosome assembly RNA-binding protein YhbY [Deltaproteobacteria bacterium]MBT6489058.1 ribosome assembly RNA-binding protein YhbY [Deltaproteobacteria bacterium]